MGMFDSSKHKRDSHGRWSTTTGGGMTAKVRTGGFDNPHANADHHADSAKRHADKAESYAKRATKLRTSIGAGAADKSKIDTGARKAMLAVAEAKSAHHAAKAVAHAAAAKQYGQKALSHEAEQHAHRAIDAHDSAHGESSQKPKLSKKAANEAAKQAMIAQDKKSSWHGSTAGHTDVITKNPTEKAHAASEEARAARSTAKEASYKAKMTGSANDHMTAHHANANAAEKSHAAKHAWEASGNPGNNATYNAGKASEHEAKAHEHLAAIESKSKFTGEHTQDGLSLHDMASKKSKFSAQQLAGEKNSLAQSATTRANSVEAQSGLSPTAKIAHAKAAVAHAAAGNVEQAAHHRAKATGQHHDLLSPEEHDKLKNAGKSAKVGTIISTGNAKADALSAKAKDAGKLANAEGKKASNSGQSEHHDDAVDAHDHAVDLHRAARDYHKKASNAADEAGKPDLADAHSSAADHHRDRIAYHKERSEHHENASEDADPSVPHTKESADATMMKARAATRKADLSEKNPADHEKAEKLNRDAASAYTSIGDHATAKKHTDQASHHHAQAANAREDIAFSKHK